MKYKYINGTSEHIYLAYEVYGFGKECSNCKSTDKLHIHHKNEDGENNRKDNLQILCRSCHRRHHMTRENNPNFGKKLSESHKQAISESQKGRVFTKEHKEKLKKSRAGRIYSLESKMKMSESQTKRRLREKIM